MPQYRPRPRSRPHRPRRRYRAAKAAAAASSGPCSTGTSTRSVSQNLGATLMPDWRIARVTGDDALTRFGGSRFCPDPEPFSHAYGNLMPLDQALPAFDVRADFWSLRFVRERAPESYAVRKNVAMYSWYRPTAAPMATVYVEGDTVAIPGTRPRPAAFRPRGALGRAPPRAAPCLTLRSLPCPRPPLVPVPGFDQRMPSRRSGNDLPHAESPGRRVRPADRRWEASIEVRTATHRLVTSTGGDVVQEYHMPARPVRHRPRRRRHADAIAQRLPRHLPAGRGSRSSRACRGCRRRRVAEEALELLAAQLPERCHGRAARARPDDPADPRVDRVDPLELDRILGDERKLRGHELRHAGHVRHVPLRLRPPQHHLRSDAARGSSRATRTTTKARAPRRST